MMASLLWLLALLAAGSGGERAGAGHDLGLGWLPEDTRTVVVTDGQNAPIVKLLSSMTAKTACSRQLLGALSATYQVWRGADDHAAAFVLHGDIDRKAWETCAVAALGDLGLVMRLQDEGDLTQVILDNGRPWFVGFAKGWLVQHADRMRVKRILLALQQSRRGKPKRPRALSQVTKTSSLWGASDLDYTRRLLGVPSRGFIAVLGYAGSVPVMQFTVLFAKQAQAAAAERALAAKAMDDKLSPDVRRFLSSLAPQQKQDQLVVTFDASVLADKAIMAALQGLVDPSKAAEQARDAAAEAGFSDADDAPCPAQSSFEMRQAVQSAQPGFRAVTWEGATWFLAPQPMLCARQLRAITSEGSAPKLELVASLTPAGRHGLRRETGANVGEHLAVLLGGEVWSIALIETPLTPEIPCVDYV